MTEAIDSFAFTPPLNPSVAVAGSTQRFPVRRILCVGRNYADHTQEMGKDPDKTPPFFFFKPSDAIVDSGSVMPYPPLTNSLHHEIELVVAIGKEGSDLDPAASSDYIYGYAVGLDMTRRDLQLRAREAGEPWDWGKSFDFSAPCGPIHSAGSVGDLGHRSIWLTVNGVVRQSSQLHHMIWSVPDIVSIASKAMTLKPGDLNFTGTPAGVGAVSPGDELLGGIDGLGEIALSISLRLRD